MWLVPPPHFFSLIRHRYWQDKGMVIPWRCSFKVIAPLFYMVTIFWGVTLSDTHFHSFPILFDYTINVGVFRVKLNWPCFSTLLKFLPASQLIDDHSVLLWINCFKCFKTRCTNSLEWKLVLFRFSLYHCIHSLVFHSKKSMLCL